MHASKNEPIYSLFFLSPFLSNVLTSLTFARWLSDAMRTRRSDRVEEQRGVSEAIDRTNWKDEEVGLDDW